MKTWDENLGSRNAGQLSPELMRGISRVVGTARVGAAPRRDLSATRRAVRYFPNTSAAVEWTGGLKLFPLKKALGSHSLRDRPLARAFEAVVRRYATQAGTSARFGGFRAIPSPSDSSGQRLRSTGLHPRGVKAPSASGGVVKKSGEIDPSAVRIRSQRAAKHL
jgi:hypothetical protein